jgi:hypothetical protein
VRRSAGVVVEHDGAQLVCRAKGQADQLGGEERPDGGERKVEHDRTDQHATVLAHDGGEDGAEQEWQDE